MPEVNSSHAKLIRQIETISRLVEADRLAIAGLPLRTRVIDGGHDLVQQGQRPIESCVILSGVACRYKIIAGGARQILSFHFAGDMPDLQSMPLERMDHSVAALTISEVGWIPHEAIRALCAERPAVAHAFYRQAMVDSSIFREWIANVGRRIALQKVSHVICECFERMRAVGLAHGNHFELPITQNELGDATGLSTVHINRTMQALRRDGLLLSRGRVHTIPDWARLKEAADYDAEYLHLLPVAPSTPSRENIVAGDPVHDTRPAAQGMRPA